MKERDILRRTSRSFYLTIRLLPRVVCDDVALAYLLARATDTIADTSTEPVEKRITLLRAARSSLQSPAIDAYAASFWARGQRDASEAALLRALPDLWEQMQSRTVEVRALLARVMDHILEGQIFDLERFTPDASPLGADELERYTYLVAGSVGEFWHDLCRLKNGSYASDGDEVMRQRARQYGQGLQLVNIIRDRRMDDALGRIYVTAGEVSRVTKQAREWLGEGARYCAALRSGRLRYATVLPALFGFRTLGLCAAQTSATLTPVKVPRAEVRRWMLRAMPVWWSSTAVLPIAQRAAE